MSVQPDPQGNAQKMQKSARFNVPSPGAPPTTTSDETSVFDMYPAHTLPTTYAYSSTNQVTQQL